MGRLSDRIREEMTPRKIAMDILIFCFGLGMALLSAMARGYKLW